MATVTLGIKVDETLRSRIKDAATLQGRTSHWLIKQAVLQYVEGIERGHRTASCNRRCNQYGRSSRN